MADMKKIATRESYGNALVELGSMRTWRFWMLTWQVLPRPVPLRRHSPSATLTAALLRQT